MRVWLYLSARAAGTRTRPARAPCQDPRVPPASCRLSRGHLAPESEGETPSGVPRLGGAALPVQALPVKHSHTRPRTAARFVDKTQRILYNPVKKIISTHAQRQERNMLPAHTSLAVSAHFRPAPSIFATGNGEKPRVLLTTWAFSRLPEPEPISFSTSRLHHKSAPQKGPKRPTFSPCGIFIQSPLLDLPFTATQRRSGVAVLEWARIPRSNQTCQGPVPGPACTAGISPASCPAMAGSRGHPTPESEGETPSGLPRLGGAALPLRASLIEYCRSLNALACRHQAWFNGRDGCCCEGVALRLCQKEGFSARVNSSRVC
jgi:hypothetical protein